MEKRKVTKQIPYACPVCKGKGELSAELAQYDAKPKYEGLHIYACHVCCGSCLIWEIREEEMPEEPDLTQIQLPPTILNPQIPNLPNIGLPQQPFTFDPNPYKVTWTSASNRPPELGKLPDMQSFNSPAWTFEVTGDGVALCKSCGGPMYMVPGKGCQTTSSHMIGN